MKITEEILILFEKNSARVKAGYVEILVSQKDGELKSSGSKVLQQGFIPIPYEKLEDKNVKPEKGARSRTFTVKAGDKDIHCLTAPVMKDENVTFCILFQSSDPFGEEATNLFNLVAAVATMTADLQGSSVGQQDREYKSELMSVRQMQAMLFPSFDDVKGIDIGAVYLPARLMSGNFIDAFYLNDDIYQIATCVVSGYDATSSFVGAAVRTLLRSTSSPTIIPSAFLEIMTQKLAKIVSGVNALVNIAVYQINTKNGRVAVSSYGSVDTLFYVANKKSSIALNDTEIGKDLTRRTVLKDLSFMMEPGDSILFYSQGVIRAESEDGSAVYGIQRLRDKLKMGIDNPSTEHVQNISQDVFEFSNYAPLKDDIILMRAKKI